jgi:PKD repeat protein
VAWGRPEYNYLWDFADGSTSSEADPSHTFITEDTYIVVLSVTDADSNTASTNTTITVVPKLTVSPTILDITEGETGVVIITGGTSPYAVRSSDSSVATATVSGDTVSVTGVGGGTATLTVTDSDSDQVFVDVTVSAPLQTTVDLDPDIFVVRVKNRQPREPRSAFLRAYIELPEGVSAEDVDTSSIILSKDDSMLADAEFD